MFKKIKKIAWPKKTEITVGLDIGGACLKIVQLIRKGANFQLQKIAVKPLEVKGKEKISEIIKQTVRELGISTNKVNVAVGGPSVIVRYILLPQMPKSQLESAARYEAEKYIPFDINDVILNFLTLEENREDKKVKILLVAAKKNLINSYVEMLNQAGLEPQVIDVDSFALINAFLLNYPEESKGRIVALVNIGANITNINILRNGVSHFTRDITLGGAHITKVMCEKLNLDAKAAEELKINPGQRKEEILNVIMAVVSNLLGEISLSFSYYEDQLERGIDRVYLSGGGSTVEGVDKFLSENLGIEIVKWNPTAKILLGPEINNEKLKRYAPLLAVGVGLALASP